MPEVLQAGPLMIRTSWLLLALAAIAGYLLIRWKLNKVGDKGRELPDLIGNAILIILLTWKLSPAIFNPSVLWTNPASLLFVNGSGMGLWLGLGLALVYLEAARRKRGIDRPFLLDTMAYWAGLIAVVYYLFIWQYGKATEWPWGIAVGYSNYRYHPVNLYIVLILLPSYIWMWRKGGRLGSGKLFSHFLTFYGIALLAGSFFRVSDPLWAGLTAEQLLATGMALAGVLAFPQSKEKTS